MSRTRAIVSIAASTLLVCTFIARAASADPRSEAAAKDALQKAQNDYLALNYTAAATRLSKAAQVCGAKNCTSITKATVLRDLGTMQFRAGDKNAAAKSWADALALQPTITVSPDYDASDVGAAWEDARAVAGLPAGPISTKPPPSAAAAGAPPAGGGAAVTGARPGGAAGARGAPGAATAPPPPAEPMGEQPTGDFVHDPAPEQKEDTPLPIHVEYTGSSKLAHVVVKYKGAQMREWARVELKHSDTASPVWEGAIPCADIGRGTMRYWVQGFDRGGEPLAATGDPKHPYYVPIRDKITSEAPRLPGKEPPKSCEESDCPPGLAGCKGAKKEGGDAASNDTGSAGAASEATGTGAPEETAAEGEEKKAQPAYRRLWVGASVDFDFLSMNSETNVCKRNTMSGNPVNASGYYCYDSVAGGDFPAGVDANNTLNKAGTTSGGFQLGNVRVLLAFDYAWKPNVLIGGRLGYVFNAYPGTAANHFLPIHIEARGTYLLGRAPLVHGFAPLGFVALSVSEFDAHQATQVTFNNGMPIKTVDVWSTDAPVFVALGVGARYQFSPRVALTAALRLNVVIGGNGVMPTVGPEIGAQYGF
jgi:hypothetical protein